LLAGGDIMPPTLLLLDSAPNIQPIDVIRSHTQWEQERLTQRERDVLCLVGKGRPNKIIAAQLELDESVVKNYVRTLMRKTGTHNRVELALAFAQSRLFS
jgi:DNA-binding NarL/FixJ family response regulator